MIQLGIVALFGVVSLIALRWFFVDRREHRAHELEVHTRRVTFDQAELDADRSKVKQLEARVKTLEYRPTK